MEVQAYFGPPGAERKLASAGVSTRARIDTGADRTVVTAEIVEKAYGQANYPCSSVTVATATGGTMEVRVVPLLIGLKAADGIIPAQVDCLVADGAGILIGNDVLSLLGLGLRIDYQAQRVHLERYSWRGFEDEVASLYRALGATVKQNVNLAGFQIDMLVTERTQSGQQLRLGVECKFYKDQIGNRLVNDFTRVISTLKTAGLVDRGVMVAYRGFTQDATLVAQTASMELLTLDDLKQQVPGSAPASAPTHATKPAVEPKTAEAPKSIRHCFVVMPFSGDLDDVYHLGIRETIGQIGGACERADEIQYTGGILEKIYDSIRRADVVIAEVSQPNPNVYYEIGFAHALGKPVVLLTRDVGRTPFDLRGYNHIVYTNIMELRQRLRGLLAQLTA